MMSFFIYIFALKTKTETENDSIRQCSSKPRGYQ